ncbi:MAG: hypothetical protein NC321_16115 [Clostridium sp.]|nr:hypothetical protein [Lachnospiraceae bacterium]MCM1254344.1 hypothetical protein [Clostridium sp.]
MNRPEISSVAISPNPANAKASIKISVTVADKVITFEKVAEYAKEIYAGQQIGVL